MRRLRKFSSGQGAAELALALPVVVVLLFVVCQFARVFYTAMGIASAARAGVQYGPQSYVKAIDTTGMNAAATADGQNIPGLTASSTHFCMCDGDQCSPSQSNPCIVSCSAPPSTCTEPKVFVKVTTTATFQTGVSWGLPSTIPLSSVAVMQAQKGTS